MIQVSAHGCLGRTTPLADVWQRTVTNRVSPGSLHREESAGTEEHSMGRRLYVGNLPFETGETELQELFGQAGAVESVRVVRDMATGRARGFAFVEMGSDEDAQKAIQQLHETQLGGRTLTVNEARPKPDGGGFGGGGGRGGFGGGGGNRGGGGGGRGGRGGRGGGGGGGGREPRW